MISMIWRWASSALAIFGEFLGNKRRRTAANNAAACPGSRHNVRSIRAAGGEFFAALPLVVLVLCVTVTQPLGPDAPWT